MYRISYSFAHTQKKEILMSEEPAKYKYQKKHESPELVICARPQLSIHLNEYHYVTIASLSIGSDSKTVERNEVTFPGDMLLELIELLDTLRKSTGG
ncbi:hypothetical protein FG476_02015 [Xylella fastidiosa subsp. multiplex]|uniref:Uncharacterized protein n=2 Tax=Xylella fastidiosa TaxID=2371 RepID=A0A9Q4MHD7_XYLFS|nr:hypothetical protein [Xylella fastidiosa subsp. multiplex]MBE0276401.1 hypothetical protein [Xylella fastidiosa subsp. multiplex]MBE0278599.1 hypothetical protein [Xylella fastidiosa subsp. multiplex]MBE0283002.1 hypothetical protein [Xylella fastidiosa subsp. multiplex]MRT52471.1 hypothetical protein [Xylella fastidiosa subsp. multiplex]